MKRSRSSSVKVLRLFLFFEHTYVIADFDAIRSEAWPLLYLGEYIEPNEARRFCRWNFTCIR